MKIVSIVGARPQFIKLRPVSRALREGGVEEFVLHTGQHYDYRMSAIFFEHLGLPEPDHNLEIGSALHARQVAAMLEGIAEVLTRQEPDVALVFGDTNSTLAGALAASMASIPVGHVEAGMRSFDWSMPEELNRVMADHAADYLFAASVRAEENLRGEGVRGRIVFTGDTMLDTLLELREGAETRCGILEKLDLRPGGYHVATLHRAGNTDDPARLSAALDILAGVEAPVVFPLHPRTLEAIRSQSWEHRLREGGLRAIDPLGYVEMIALVSGSRGVLTDSGGLQKEAFYLGVPCVTLREETEWTETVELGWNRLVGVSPGKAREALSRSEAPKPPGAPYGEGRAGEAIAEFLLGLE